MLLTSELPLQPPIFSDVKSINSFLSDLPFTLAFTSSEIVEAANISGIGIRRGGVRMILSEINRLSMYLCG